MSEQRKNLAWLVLTVIVQGAAVSAGDLAHDVFDFAAANPAEGWYVNIFRKNAQGEKGVGAVRVVPGRCGGKALEVSSTDAGSYNCVSPLVADGDWRERRYYAVEVWYKGDGSKNKMSVKLLTESGTDKANGYVATLFLGSTDWRREVLTGFWKREGTPPLDLSKLLRLYVAGSGTRTVTIAAISLLAGRRGIYLEPGDRPEATVPLLSAAPTLDGRLDDAAWTGAQVFEQFAVGPEQTPATYSTRVLIGYREHTLYLGARLCGEVPGQIPAKWREFDTPVWQDSSLEFYLDPADGNERGYQFVVNSVGTRQDICRSKAWNGEWQAQARLDEVDGWQVEIACDLRSVDASASLSVPWGFNLKRHVVDAAGKFAEVSGWAQATPTPASGFGTLLFEPVSASGLALRDVELHELQEGEYVCRSRIVNTGDTALSGTLSAQVFLPQASGSHEFGGDFTIAAGGETVLGVPLTFALERDGKHMLVVRATDSAGRIAGREQFSFHLSKRATAAFSDIVLWPPPRRMDLKDGSWALPESLRLRCQGALDGFPAEHLAERLSARYGVQVERVGAGAADISLVYAERGIKPEGFTLDVNASGIALHAADGRGMYYAIRTVLDLLKLSTVGEAPAQVRCVHIEDWPGAVLRVHYHRIDHNYLVPFGADAYKDYIYNQLAAGRFNLLILNCRGGLQYDSHPELARRGALSKEQLREILAFARRHYIDVAPGGNTPGHGSWIAAKHTALREDGDYGTLCTRHPDALPMVKEIYSELLELFQPTKYFHLGGDEVRWQTATKPEAERCSLCSGIDKRELLLEHWTALAEFCREKGVRPILWEDMLSERWNGGAPYHTAQILPRLPRDIIMSSWSSGELSNSAAVYRDLGFIPWRVTTSFGPSRVDTLLEWWDDYEALGIAQFTTSPWLTFSHFSYQKHCNYATPAVHICASCMWNPQSAAVGWHRMAATYGLHWTRLMNVTDWGTRRIAYEPVSIADACNDTTVDSVAGDGQGWMDTGPDADLRDLPRGRFTVGDVPFERPSLDKDCIVIRGEEAAQAVAVGRKVRGLVFLHTAGADEEGVKALQQRVFRKNTVPDGMPVAFYRVNYADGTAQDVPAQIGRNIHLWNCWGPARVMQGASGFWTGLTSGQTEKDPNSPDACAWLLEWKNLKPDIVVRDITVVGAGTEAVVALLGVTAVE